MDAITADFERLEKKSNLSKVPDGIDQIISLLQNARDQIAEDPDTTALTLARLQQSLTPSFNTLNTLHTDLYRTLNRHTKTLNSTFKPTTTNLLHTSPLLSSPTLASPTTAPLLTRATALHLLRSGNFSIFATLLSESPSLIPLIPPNLESAFTNLYSILHSLTSSNLDPAITWATTHAPQLEARGSNLLYSLHRLSFINLLLAHPTPNPPSPALTYLKSHLTTFLSPHHVAETQRLFCGFLYLPLPDLLANPIYGPAFRDVDKVLEGLKSEFVREFCALMEPAMGEEPPLLKVCMAGQVAVPVLVKVAGIVERKGAEWSSVGEMPVEVPLPEGTESTSSTAPKGPSGSGGPRGSGGEGQGGGTGKWRWHNVFVCPVSKEQAVEGNWPCRLECGHVVARESLIRLVKGRGGRVVQNGGGEGEEVGDVGVRGVVKCPYCPMECDVSKARRCYI